MLVVIDADSIVYKAGFACETAIYEVVAEDATGSMQAASFSSADAANAWVHEIGADPTYVETSVRKVAEPVENCLQIVRTMIRNIVADTCPGRPLLFLSGHVNYRERLATIRPYKGNRDKLHKPLHYEAMRYYLIDTHGAQVSDGNEADDEVSIYARSHEVIVAGVDKDLDQIPGRHYDYGKRLHFSISSEEAEEQFWLQVLQGDPSDNVGGVYRMGPVAARNWLKQPHDDTWRYVVRAYELSQEKPGCPYANMPAEDAALENARLVYLQQSPGELWRPHGKRGLVQELYA